MNLIVSTVYAFSLAIAPGPTPRGGASDTVALDVDVTALGEFGELIESRVNFELREHATQRGLKLDPQARGRVRVVVKPRKDTTSSFEYSIETSPWASDAPKSSTDGVCDPCTDEMVVEKIQDALAPRFDALHDTAAATPAAVVSPAATSAEPASPGAAAPPASDGRKLSRLAVAGIALSGIGAAGVVAGAVVATRRDTLTRQAGDHAQNQRRTLQEPGIAIAVVGGAALITGVVLLAVSAKRSPRKVSVLPMAGRRFVSMALRGRF